jgi:two-component system chemotaxis response regulator CheY
MAAAKTVLVVDDVLFARKIITKILTDAKYNVVGEATNGQEAFQMHGRLKPDIVIMDVVMPVKGGIEAARAILEADKEARIIMVSAMAHEQLLMEAINAGAKDYILKPFSPEDLIRAIDKVMQEDDDFVPNNRGASLG